MKTNCPHCDFESDFDDKECPVCLQDITASEINKQAIYERVFSLIEKAEPSRVRLPIPIASDRVVWIDMPADYTKTESVRLLKIIEQLAEFAEEDEREREAMLERFYLRHPELKQNSQTGEPL